MRLTGGGVRHVMTHFLGYPTGNTMRNASAKFNVNGVSASHRDRGSSTDFMDNGDQKSVRVSLTGGGVRHVMTLFWNIIRAILCGMLLQSLPSMAYRRPIATGGQVRIFWTKETKSQ